MKVILHVQSGPSEGRQIPLQAGEIARFGSSDFADVCFPNDPRMSEVHFELHCRQDGCRIRNLDAAVGTLLNDQPVDEASFDDGDRIVAGQTCLRASVQGHFYADPSSETTAEGFADEATDSGPITAEELCQSLALEEASKRLLRPNLLPEPFIDALVEQQQYADAIRVLAIYLPKPTAIRWALECFTTAGHGTLSPTDQNCVHTVHAWLDEPGDSQRRAAKDAAEASEYSGPVSWIAMAVFWSGGSIAPPDLPEVTPDPELCGQGVNAALLMLATQGDPTRAQERFLRIVQAGQDKLAEAEA